MTKILVGTGRFELPTPRTPSECSTRLSHVPTRKEPAALHSQRMGLTRGFYHQRRSFAAFDCAGRHRRLRFDFREKGFDEGRVGVSSKIANWIFLSTGSMRSTRTRILCPRL